MNKPKDRLKSFFASLGRFQFKILQLYLDSF